MAHYAKKERKVKLKRSLDLKYLKCFECEAQVSRFLCHTEKVDKNE